MKSFVEYPLDFEKMLFPDVADKSYSGKLIAHYELYRKVSHLEGSVVKCGIAAEEGFTRFAILRNLIAAQPNQKVIAFEKFSKSLCLTNNNEDAGELQYQIKRTPIDIDRIQQKLLKKGITEKIEFVPGNIGDSIPEYLMENPELKIAYLNIDFDDYDSALTTLQFFYPRLVHGGILIFDNYYKKEEDYRAVKDYFKYSISRIYNFSVNKGPHYLVRM
ncbi:MAG: dTDP-6-deoxy-L-hexose 3-O-methyltransferase [Segetibacter sp.]|nr:dTDP-6-deoxy-L-hexose 3-O-methyltransferase [Segetibacter sp.]